MVAAAAVTFFLDRFALVFHATLRNAVEHEAAHKLEVIERLESSETPREEQQVIAVVVESLPGIFNLLAEAGSCLRWNRDLSKALA